VTGGRKGLEEPRLTRRQAISPRRRPPRPGGGDHRSRAPLPDDGSPSPPTAAPRRSPARSRSPPGPAARPRTGPHPPARPRPSRPRPGWETQTTAAIETISTGSNGIPGRDGNTAVTTGAPALRHDRAALEWNATLLKAVLRSNPEAEAAAAIRALSAGRVQSLGVFRSRARTGPPARLVQGWRASVVVQHPGERAGQRLALTG